MGIWEPLMRKGIMPTRPRRDLERRFGQIGSARETEI
jgi:hypothetical protein